MRSSTRVTKREEVAIKMARQHGATIEAIAIRYQRSRNTVRRIVKDIPAKHANAKVSISKPHQKTAIDREPVKASEVCRYVEGGSTGVSHGLGAEHAKRTLAAMTRGRTPLPGYPRTEEVE